MIQDIQELRQTVIDAFQVIDVHQLQNKWRKLEYRLEKIKAINGEKLEIGWIKLRYIDWELGRSFELSKTNNYYV